jgi:anti-sigma B factor antagonist
MEISTGSRGDVAVVAIAGSVDALTADELTTYLDGRVREGKVRLVADLSRVVYVSSAGLRSFLATLKAARQAGGDLHLAAAQENVQNLLAIAGFTSIMKTYPDVDTAVADW